MLNHNNELCCPEAKKNGVAEVKTELETVEWYS